LSEVNKSIDDVLQLLWKMYQTNPNKGLTELEIYKIIEEVGGPAIRENFEEMTSTTKEIDFETICKKVGLKVEWDHSVLPYLGFDPEFAGDRVLAKVVTLDGPAYKGGLNAGDEILAINGMRVLKERFNDFQKYLKVNETYRFTISRLNHIEVVDINVSVMPNKLKHFEIVDRTNLEKSLGKKF
jgi:predicted metalloprotease with PDZ domain